MLGGLVAAARAARSAEPGQGRGDSLQLVHGRLEVAAVYQERYVIGTGRQVRVHRLRDGVRIAVRHHCIHQAVANGLDVVGGIPELREQRRA